MIMHKLNHKNIYSIFNQIYNSFLNSLLSTSGIWIYLTEVYYSSKLFSNFIKLENKKKKIWCH